MTDHEYIHGYTQEEQDRLVDQAEYWRDTILSDLDYQPGDHVLEIGCGAGAVLGILAEAFPGTSFSGIDLSNEQIEYALEHLKEFGPRINELMVGSAYELPWPDDSFDHIYVMWVIEHLDRPMDLLREAHRVLKPGGSITLTETDYSSIQISPPNKDYSIFLEAFLAYFSQAGDPLVGRRLGSYMSQAGFSSVTNQMLGLHYWNPDSTDALATHVDYMAGFIEPILEDIARYSGVEIERIQRGYQAYLDVKTDPQGALSHVIYRGKAIYL